MPKGLQSEESVGDVRSGAAAFKKNPFSNATFEIDCLASSPGWGCELREQTISGWQSIKDDTDPSQRFSKGHFEQPGCVIGLLTLDGPGDSSEYRLGALGMRDRSWGPRYWQAPEYYRWLTMNFDETTCP